MKAERRDSALATGSGILVAIQASEAVRLPRGPLRHSRAGGNPVNSATRLDSRLRGNDVLRLAGVLCVLVVLAVFALQARVAGAEETDVARRERIGAMTPAEKDRLRRRQERFATLPDDEKQRLRQFHKQLENDPQAEQMRAVMRRYHQWLETLSPFERAELLELPPPQRLDRVKKLVERQAKIAARQPNPRDIMGLMRWTVWYAAEHKMELMRDLPESARAPLAKAPPLARGRVVFWAVWQPWIGKGPPKRPMPTEAELAALRAELTDQTRKLLESKPVDQQWDWIVGYVRHAMHHRAKGLGGDEAFPEAMEEELDRFFAEELTPEQQDRLLQLPGNEMQRELRKLYITRQNLPDPPRRRPPMRDMRPGRRGGPESDRRDSPW